MSALLHMSVFEYLASCACTLEEAGDEPAIAARGADSAVLYAAALMYLRPRICDACMLHVTLCSTRVSAGVQLAARGMMPALDDRQIRRNN